MSFPTLGLMPALVQAAGEVGYFDPTPIQQAAIPAVVRGQDVLGLAQTGSGKTAAFSLPLLQRWAQAPRHRSRRAVHTLVLVPTRELAAQVGETFRLLSVRLHERPRIAVLFGGLSINPQMMGLRGGADIVVATPGRLLDLLDHNAIRLDAVQALVLDEADRLLDLGFAKELGRVLAALPARRQNLFFSATFAQAVEALATQLLHEPLRIEVEATPETVPDIAQRAIEVDAGRRTQLLRHLVNEEKWPRVLAFVATKHAAEVVADKLRKAGIEAEPFHGMLGQGKRSQVVADFKASRLQVVVATDLAARGIDIAQLPVVVNYDLPRSAGDFVHRIGRTGRAGERGLALSFIAAESEAHFRVIEKRQGLRVPRERIAGFEPVEVATAPPATSPEDTAGGIKGRRPSKKDKLRAAAALEAAGRAGAAP
ncbi:DEAD/DEAH box helicase [Variovorax guangxiensis]|uniref:DEAD/DEAH box helicase n=1 Tax=Variovorax guangxiensis TaxID=1775474 RepID=UPI00286784BD|nr:DEAD/DEAH box helicase [Variovorax guangxiensis]MDR6859481.1 superfamily II DNA/RNA helicase [Variovorax guangxiensis]